MILSKKARGRNSGSIPGPSSSTRKHTASPGSIPTTWFAGSAGASPTRITTVVAPWVRGAWLDGIAPGAPWAASGGLRPVTGLGIEWLHQLVRLEFVVDPKRSKWALLVDLHQGLWPLL